MMKKIMTKVTAVLLVIAMLGIQVESNTWVAEAANKAVKVGRGMYTITSEKFKTARFDKVAKKSVTTISIPATVKIGKKTYKVTAIKKNALKGNKNVKKMTIGKNVIQIGSKAFYGCTNLKNITIKTTKLTNKSVGANAFGKLNSNVKIKMPTSKTAEYEKILKEKGVKGKSQTDNADNSGSEVQKPDVIPAPEAELSIGELIENKGEYIYRSKWNTTTTTADGVIENKLTFNTRVDIPLETYGYWAKERVTTDWKKTCYCGLAFKTNEDYLVHRYQVGGSGYDIAKSAKKNLTFDASVWHADNTPCTLEYHIAIPEGLEIDRNSISINRLSGFNELMDPISEDNYKVSIENNILTISATDIKSGGFLSSTGNVMYLPIVASFSAKVTETAQPVNTITASVSYNCGQYNGTVNTNPVTVNKK